MAFAPSRKSVTCPNDEDLRRFFEDFIKNKSNIVMNVKLEVHANVDLTPLELRLLQEQQQRSPLLSLTNEIGKA
jgi:predicted urease superfamily metal-dependent hydrolase